MKTHAFTLIEVLVVILIIGILAAIAVPQYQKAVEKSKMMDALSLGKHMQQLQQMNSLVNGVYVGSIRELEMDIPVGYKFFGDTLSEVNGATHFVLERYINGKGHNRIVYNYYHGRTIELALFFWYQGPISCNYYTNWGKNMCKVLGF